MNSSVSLPGVIILSDALLGGSDTFKASGVIDEGSDLSAFLVIGVPFIVLWVCGITFVSLYTDDDGYLTGLRVVESKNHSALRMLLSFMAYVVEGGQLISCVLTPATIQWLLTSAFTTPAKIWLWYGSLSVTFPICVSFQLLWTMFFVIPMLLWFTMKREKFKSVEKMLTSGTLGLIISFFQDCFMIWVPLPMMIQLLRPIPCTFYLDSTPSSALDETVECLSRKHLEYAVTGGVVFLLTFLVGVSAGAVPSLVHRYADTSLNGRFMSISFAVKAMIAVVYTVCQSRHEFYLTGGIVALQVFLLFLSISLRPSLVERVNYHRSGAYALVIIISIIVIVSAGLADPLTPLPFIIGFIGLGLAVLLLFVKYYFLTCAKLFPEIKARFIAGSPAYEGDMCLGRNLPHGHGKLRWADGRTFTGKFKYGKESGYGVFTIGKYFYEGNFQEGLRHGFGMTNLMMMLKRGDLGEKDTLDADLQAESYEGFWVANRHHGAGTKKFSDGDRFDGSFEDDLEHGTGTWTMMTSGGVYVVRGEWRRGRYEAGAFDSHEQEYSGSLRYGVPHGRGTMRIGDDAVFEGDWRAGKMHGQGTVKMFEGEYTGSFFEGLYHDEGTWKDTHGIYVGKFASGLKHGHGVETTEDGKYEGSFEKGYRHGYGTFRYNELEYYQGTWRKNDYHGTGLLVTDEYVYDGQWVDGRKEGVRGHITFKNGVEYIGGWQSDRFYDHGRLRIPGLGEYQGKFVDGNRVGQGRFRFSDGSEYNGDWDRDLANGQGRLSFLSTQAIKTFAAMSPSEVTVVHDRTFLSSGGEYVGAFEDGEFSGEGRVVCSDGAVYEGEWRHSTPYGVGTFTTTSGGRYEGEWVDGRRNGIGIMLYPDRRQYEGEWREDKRHGHGVLRALRSDGTLQILHECEWVDDAPVSEGRNVKTLASYAELPAVDIEEFLRAIMPNQSSPLEVSESRMRKRLDVEEMCYRLLGGLGLEEELGRLRLARSILTLQHSMVRNVLSKEFLEESMSLQMTTLARVLNQWKLEFRSANNRDPKKSDIMNSRSIAPIYKRYMELTRDK